MQNIWFTSDTHFNHLKCQQLFRAGRFSSVGEMNETIIQNWNDRVKKGDRVYHLGDFALGSVKAAAEIAARLKGEIYLIRGNHESVGESSQVAQRFMWIKDYHRVKVGEQKIYLCHYAFRTWNCMHHGSWHLYGHSHGSLPDLPNSLSFDVGVDCWNFKPINYDDVAAKMTTKTFEPVDHHISDAPEAM